jgi:hypothetical protein
MLSYSALTTYGKPSLPEVDDWGASAHIIRDPPKAIYTYRKDKVEDTQDAYLEGGMGDRLEEKIRVYPTGVNPMVSVSYQNSGGGTQASLPYKIMRDGDFRPPIRRQEDLLPLSRLPRHITSVVVAPDMTGRGVSFVPEDTGMTRFIRDGHRSFIRPTVVARFKKETTMPTTITKVISSREAYSATSAIAHKAMEGAVSAGGVSQCLQDSPNVSANPTYSRPFAGGVQQGDVSQYIHDKIGYNANAGYNPDTKIYAQPENVNGYIAESVLVSATAACGVRGETHRGSDVRGGLGENIPKVQATATYSTMGNVDYRNHIEGYNQQQERVLPEHSAQSKATSNMMDTGAYRAEHYLERNLPKYSALSRAKALGGGVFEPETGHRLVTKVPLHTANTALSIQRDVPRDEMTIELQRNLPSYATVSSVTGEKRYADAGRVSLVGKVVPLNVLSALYKPHVVEENTNRKVNLHPTIERSSFSNGAGYIPGRGHHLFPDGVSNERSVHDTMMSTNRR